MSCAWRTCPELPGISTGTPNLLSAASSGQFFWVRIEEDSLASSVCQAQSTGVAPLIYCPLVPRGSTSILQHQPGFQCFFPSPSDFFWFIFFILHLLPGGKKGKSLRVLFSCVQMSLLGCCSEKLHSFGFFFVIWLKINTFAYTFIILLCTFVILL